jgi:two-component system, OmpR family, response regulator
MGDKLRILVVSSEQDHLKRLAGTLSRSSWEPVASKSVSDARAAIARQPFGAIISEESLADGDFRAVIGETRRSGRQVPVVVVSRRDDWNSYLAALDAGAFEYVAFPPNPGELERAVRSALSESKHQAKGLAHAAA